MNKHRKMASLQRRQAKISRAHHRGTQSQSPKEVYMPKQSEEEKLILDQPDIVEAEGVVEYIVKKDKIQFNINELDEQDDDGPIDGITLLNG